TQDPSLDPELFFPKPASLPAYCFVLTGIPNAIRRIVDMLRLAAGRADRPWMAPAERRPLIVEARIYLAGYAVVAAASVLAGTPVVLLVWIAPWMLGQVFLRPYLLAEHTGCGVTRDCLENTRTTPTRRCPSTRSLGCTSRSGAGSSTWSPATWRPPPRSIGTSSAGALAFF